MSDPRSIPSLRDWLRDRPRGGIEGVVAFARLLRTYPLSGAMLPLYLDLFEADVPEAVDVLLEGRDPASLFAKLSHGGAAVDRVLGILSGLRPKSAPESLLLPLLGLLETLYGTASRVGSVRSLSVADVNQVGKHLLSPSEAVRQSVQRILEASAEASGETGSSAHHARRVLDAFLDRSKGLESAIPRVLLV